MNFKNIMNQPLDTFFTLKGLGLSNLVFSMVIYLLVYVKFGTEVRIESDQKNLQEINKLLISGRSIIFAGFLFEWLFQNLLQHLRRVVIVKGDVGDHVVVVLMIG